MNSDPLAEQKKTWQECSLNLSRETWEVRIDRLLKLEAGSIPRRPAEFMRNIVVMIELSSSDLPPDMPKLSTIEVSPGERKPMQEVLKELLGLQGKAIDETRRVKLRPSNPRFDTPEESVASRVARRRKSNPELVNREQILIDALARGFKNYSKRLQEYKSPNEIPDKNSLGEALSTFAATADLIADFCESPDCSVFTRFNREPTGWALG